jgi:hypothetical protein
LRHNKNCGWIVVPGVAYCPECLQPVIREEQVQLESDVEAATPDQAAPTPPVTLATDAVTCPACRRQVLPTAEGTCPWDGEPLLSTPSASSAFVSTMEGYRAYLAQTPLTLGRLSEDEQLGAAVDKDGVSRRHASIRVDADGVVWLKDLGSTNGTWLGGNRLETEARLPPGDSGVGLGREVTVVVHVS